MESEVVIELATTDLIQQISVGNQCCAEDYIAAVSSFSNSADLKLDLVDAEICAKSDRGEVVQRKDIVERFPSLEAELSRLFEVHEIDLKASGSHAEKDVSPVSIPGYQLIRRTNESNAANIASRKFELWEVKRSSDNAMFHVVLWQCDGSVEPELKKREQVKHPALAQPLEMGVVDSHCYVVIERLNGRTLGQILDHSNEQALTGKAIARLLLGTNEARKQLEKSIGVAIPVLPHAIFIRANNTPLLIDFPFFAESEPAEPLLQLGLLLFSTCLQESDVREVQQHLDAGFEPIALNKINGSVSSELNSIYQSCVHPDPKHRYRTIDEALSNLRKFIDGKPIKTAKRKGWFGF